MEQAGVLDLVCVSHIDDDHITGIVELYRRRTEWAAHHADNMIPEPTFGEPPIIKRLWHNALEVTVNPDAGPGVTTALVAMNSELNNQLAFHEQLLNALPELKDREFGHRMNRIALGARLAIELELRFLQSPMNIEFNGPTNGELIKVNDTPVVEKIGDISIHILSPFQEDLDRLKTDWDKWVAKNQARVKEMKEEFKKTNAAMDALKFLEFAARQASLGEFDDVTPPNLASITFLLEENGQTILMTGDHASEGEATSPGKPMKRGIIEGLAHADLIEQPAGGLHVHVLKVPHHGAEANTSVGFAKRITADHYVFCANGRHHNPELDVIETYVNSRLSDDDNVRSANPEVGNRFKLWFNYSVDDTETKANDNFLKQMQLVKEKVESLAAGDRFDFEFSNNSSFTIDLDN